MTTDLTPEQVAEILIRLVRECCNRSQHYNLEGTFGVVLEHEDACKGSGTVPLLPGVAVECVCLTIQKLTGETFLQQCCASCQHRQVHTADCHTCHGFLKVPSTDAWAWLEAVGKGNGLSARSGIDIAVSSLAGKEAFFRALLAALGPQSLNLAVVTKEVKEMGV